MNLSSCFVVLFISLVNGKALPQVTNSTHCVYLPESKTLTCRGQTGEVECDAVGNFSALSSDMLQVFGIGRLPVEPVDSKTESIKYFLYPRNLDNQTYFNYSVTAGQKLIDLMLYSAESIVEYGIRVPELNCFEKLVDLFRSSTEDHIVSLSSDFIEKPMVSLIGEILNGDKVIQKKHGWGNGWGNSWGNSWGHGWGKYKHDDDWDFDFDWDK